MVYGTYSICVSGETLYKRKLYEYITNLEYYMQCFEGRFLRADFINDSVPLFTSFLMNAGGSVGHVHNFKMNT